MGASIWIRWHSSARFEFNRAGPRDTRYPAYRAESEVSMVADAETERHTGPSGWWGQTEGGGRGGRGEAVREREEGAKEGEEGKGGRGKERKRTEGARRGGRGGGGGEAGEEGGKGGKGGGGGGGGGKGGRGGGGGGGGGEGRGGGGREGAMGRKGWERERGGTWREADSGQVEGWISPICACKSVLEIRERRILPFRRRTPLKFR